MLRFVTPLAIIVAVAVAGAANAQYYPQQYQSYGNYGNYGSPYNGGSGPVYHPPSVHYDRVYHPEYSHWTPNRGWHTHGHYHAVPHYTPGHYDYQYGNVIVPNPYYHRH